MSDKISLFGNAVTVSHVTVHEMCLRAIRDKKMTEFISQDSEKARATIHELEGLNMIVLDQNYAELLAKERRGEGKTTLGDIYGTYKLTDRAKNNLEKVDRLRRGLVTSGSF